MATTLPLIQRTEDADAAYTAVSGGSPTSAPGSPTAREVRLECKPTSPTAAPQEVAGEVVEHPVRQRVCVGVGVGLGLATLAGIAAVCAFVAVRPAGPQFAKITHGSCESNGMERIRSAKICAQAAKDLALHDQTVEEVPRDAVAGLYRTLTDSMPQDCYYLVIEGTEKHETLWFNPHLAGTEATTASSGPIARQPICLVPPEKAARMAALRGQAPHSADPWGIAKELPLPDVVKSAVFGTSSTTTTSTLTWTGTSTTSTTVTQTTTVTTTITSTTTFTTLYHTRPLLFCFSVVRTKSYELNNMRTALAKKMSIFACDDQIVFTDEQVDLQPGVPVPGWGDLKWVGDVPPVKTTVLRIGLDTHPKAGSLEGILNTEIFMQAWRQIDEDGRFRMHDWTVKVDPDAVFFPQRLIPDLLQIAPASSSPNVYVVNCKISFGLFGAVEVFSRVALENYIQGASRCKKELDWTMMGEDLYMRRCMDLLGVQPAEDYHMLSDGYCSEQASPCVSGKVAFHPFKSALSYHQCFVEAITPTTTTTTETTTTVTTTTLKKANHTGNHTVHHGHKKHHHKAE